MASLAVAAGCELHRFFDPTGFADWVRSIPVGGVNPTNTQIIDACDYDPLCRIRRNSQNQPIDLATYIPGLGINERPLIDLPGWSGISSRFGGSPDSWLTNSFDIGGFGGGGGGWWDSFSKIDTSRYWEL